MLATVVTVAAAVAYFLMTATSEYRFHDAVFWTTVLAAPVAFAWGPRSGMLRRIGFGITWMVTVTVATGAVVLFVVVIAVALG